PPAVCPVCGASRDAFRLVSGGAPRAATRPRRAPAGRRILIVGGGIAGHTAAHVARELDPDCRITLATDEPHRFYNRLNLTRYLAGEIGREALFDFGDDWYTAQAIEVVTEARAIDLDPVARRVVFANGLELAYDALILAHGSRAAVPRFCREGVAGLFLLRTLEDVEGILAACRPGSRAAVVGGGVLGLEAACGLAARGAEVALFECAPHLMPRQLDPEGAALLAQLVRERGVVPHVGVTVEALLGETRVAGLALADGRWFEAELIVVSTGIVPNVDWVKRAGLACRRGLVVDDRMRTSADAVYAAGDVAEWRGRVVGLWRHAVEQARVAAASAVGRPAEFDGAVPVTVLKWPGLPVASIGEILPDGGGVTSQVTRDPAQRAYRRVVFRAGLPVGALLVNTAEGLAELTRLVAAAAQVDRLAPAVGPGGAAVGG
ncbi:MAG TPA: FAD-dependent oxidoreductase, partial [Thermodesulfobacteriota bacterium]|nr:FAD-dependent oxidoreductase [Thermodesulfobacteriota bacterium]